MAITTDSGNRDPSTETVFEIPQGGLIGADTDYDIAGGSLRLNLFDIYNFPPVGVRLTFEGWRYEDRDLDVGDFTRIVGMAEVQVPLGYRSRRLAFGVRTSHSMADSGDVVPAYLMETIGGANTVRGFNEYRFRDTRNLLINAEYRWEVWTYMSLALFYDAGKVFSDTDDLNFDGMHSGYGFGVRFFAPGPVFFNVDLARSTEGLVLHIGGGPRF